MAEVPEDYDSGPGEDEDLSSETPAGPQLLPVDEVTTPDTIAEADPELPVDSKEEPQPESAGETEPERPPENAESLPRTAASIPGEDMSRELDEDSSIDTEPDTSLETSTGWMVFMDEKLDLVPQEETIMHATEEMLIESVKETDLELPEEATPEIPGATFSETRLGFLQEPKPEITEEVFREQHEESVLQSPEHIRPEFPSDTPRKSVEESDSQPPAMASSEITEERPVKWTEEQGAESPNQTTPEFLKKKPSELTEEAGLALPEEMEAEVPEETPEGSSEEADLESSEESAEEADLESPEETGPEEPPEKSAEEPELEPPEESNKEIGLELPEETRPEVPEKTPEKSREEQGIEPLAQSTAEFPELKPTKSVEDTQRKATERVLAAVEGMKSEFLEEASTEGANLEKPKAGVLEETRRKSTEGIPAPPEEVDLMLLHEIKPIHETQSMSTRERVVALPDEDMLLRGVDPSKDDSTKPVKVQHSEEASELKHPKDHTITISNKETKESLLEFHRENETEMMETDDEFSNTTKESTNSDLSDSEMNLKKLLSEDKITGLSGEVEKIIPRETQPREKADLQFKYLEWSPRDVAEWISQLGFPQYKECFTENFISGQKLIYINCSNLPQIGITDFEDMKVISRHTRELLGIEEPLFNRPIALPRRDNIGLFLEQKSHTGVKSDRLTFPEFVQATGLQDYAP